MRVNATILVGLVIACGDSGPKEAAPNSAAFDTSWPNTVVNQPARFAEVVGDERTPRREGWIALHQNDFAAAVDAFDDGSPDGKLLASRAAVERAELFQDLARVNDIAWFSTFSTWQQRTGIPAGSGLPYVAGLHALDAGDQDAAGAWLDLAAAANDSVVNQAASALKERGNVSGFSSDNENELLRTLASHELARQGGVLLPILQRANSALITEAVEMASADADGTAPALTVERRFYDPQVGRTLALGYGKQAAALAGDASPNSAILNSDLDPLAKSLFGGGAPEMLAQIDVAQNPTAEDDVEWAREQVRRLDEHLDAWEGETFASATDDGKALLQDLDLADVFRSRILLDLAREALRGDHPRRALAFAQLALDLEHPREITPVNHPALQAVIVEAQLRTGHTREALDALQVLLPAYPVLLGLDEVISDLAILQNLDRHGDSKEN